MAKILLIESATEVCGAALCENGVITTIDETTSGQQHASLLTVQIQNCLARAGATLSQIDAISMGVGPGSYTSLRVGISVAKGLCYALDKPFIAIDSLYALAFAAQKSELRPLKEGNFYVGMIDARGEQICFKIFDHLLQPVSGVETRIISNNMFVDFLGIDFFDENRFCAIFSGNGSKKIKNVFFEKKAVFSNVEQNSAAFLGEIAEKYFQLNDFQDFAHFEPIYMKSPNITISKNTHL